MPKFIPFHQVMAEGDEYREISRVYGTTLQEAVLSADDRKEMSGKQFAITDSHGVKRLPINDEKHIRAAASYGISRIQGLSSTERAQASARIQAAAQKHGINTPSLNSKVQESVRFPAASRVGGSVWDSMKGRRPQKIKVVNGKRPRPVAKDGVKGYNPWNK